MLITAPKPKTRQLFSWAAAHAIGSSHELAGEPCQDSLALRVGHCNGVPFVTAAIADGAGSARYAEEAAQLATRLFTTFVTSEITGWGLDGLDDLALDACSGVHAKLCRLAEERGVGADECATTLLGIVAVPERTALVQIGDGGIVMGSPSGAWRLAFPPQHGEYRNESRFITDADALDRLQQTVFEGSPGTVVMFTDGLEDLLITPKLDVHTPLFDYVGARLARYPARGFLDGLSTELTELMHNGSVRSRTNDDIALLAIRIEEDRHDRDL